MATDSKALGKATINFALNLLKGVSSNESLIFSPASISVCVGMAYAGSAEQTRTQINKVLFNNMADQQINDQMKVLSTTLNKPSKSYNLSMANRMPKMGSKS